MNNALENFLKNSTLVKEIMLDNENIKALLYTDVHTNSLIKYEYYMDVFEKHSDDKLFTVTSELNSFDDEPNNESYFLCMFKDGRHSNFDASNDYGDIEKFEKAAIHLIEKQLS